MRVFSAVFGIMVLATAAVAPLAAGEGQPANTDQAPPPSDKLSPGQAVVREIGAGEERDVIVELQQGQYATLAVERRGVDLISRALGPDGVTTVRFNDNPLSHGTEELSFVAESAGLHTIRVGARLRNAPQAPYEIRFVELRAATDRERAMHEAMKLDGRTQELISSGKYQEARSAAEQALAIAERESAVETVQGAMLLLRAGQALDVLGNRAASVPLYERALPILETTLGTDHPLYGYVAGRLGSSYFHTSERLKADRLLNVALENLEESLGPDHPWVAVMLRSYGNMQVGLGNDQKARSSFERALAIAEPAYGEENILVSDLLNNLGQVCLNENDNTHAREYLERSLAIAEKRYGAEHFSLANILSNLGIVARKDGDYDAAERYYLRALALREKQLGPEDPTIASNLINIGNLYRSKGDFPKSIETHNRALGILERMSTPADWGTVMALGNLAKTYTIMGDMPNAIQFQERAEAAVEASIVIDTAIGSERDKLASSKSTAERTDRTISLHLQRAPQDPRAAALATLVLLQRKGRLLDAMSDSFRALRERASPEDQASLDQLADASAQLARLVLDGPRKTPIAEYRAAVADLEARTDKLEAAISRDSAEFRAQVQDVSLATVQQTIPPDAALLEFAVYRPFEPAQSGDTYGVPHYAVYVIRNEGAPRGIDLGEVATIDETVEELRSALRDPERSDVQVPAGSLESRVLAPIREWLAGVRRLLVSPDGALNLIPFETFSDEQGRYLLERYSVSYLTAGRDLLRLRVPRESKSSPVVIADPVFGEQDTIEVASSRRAERGVATSDGSDSIYFAPLAGTAQEARKIHAVFPDARVLLGADATEAALARAGAPQIVHIATHAFFLDPAAKDAPAGTRAAGSQAPIENPLLRSGLALSGANLSRGSAEDGILTALEASRLDLWGTELVTLSACGTGLGHVENGEGVYGLRRAFLLAGAETVVMSLWPVSDYATRQLMVDYYSGLKKGLGRGDALRQAKLEMAKRRGRQHPYYWAGFIQSGEWAGLSK
jgi:CHAT domain-containing protein